MSQHEEYTSPPGFRVSGAGGTKLPCTDRPYNSTIVVFNSRCLRCLVVQSLPCTDRPRTGAVELWAPYQLLRHDPGEGIFRFGTMASLAQFSMARCRSGCPFLVTATGNGYGALTPSRTNPLP
jgi:hypothetical protein